MATDYHLDLVEVTPRIRRAMWVGGLGMAVAACGAFFLMRTLHVDSKNAVLVDIVLLLGGILAGMIWYMRAVTVPSVVRIAARQLSVRDRRRDQLTLCIDYADIAAYRHQTLTSGLEELRLTRHNGEQAYLKVASNLDVKGDFARMAREFGQQLAQLPAPVAGPGPATREKGFLEKPVATVLLLVATVAVGLLVWQVAVGHLTIGQVAGALVVYVSFLLAWRAARRPVEQ